MRGDRVRGDRVLVTGGRTMSEQHSDAVAVAEGRMCYTTIPAWVPGVDWLSIQPVTADGADECEESRG
jgi:hypothetical protein